MNTEKIAKGWALIAEGAMELSLAYEGLDSAAKAVEPAARAGTAGVEGSVGPPLPPSAPASLQETHIETRLSVCPVHGVPWVVKAAGVSKAGKRYSAFWKCAERDANGYCDQRPAAAWADAHPPAVAA